ncbi:MAG: PQQ-binding-like beta-propeller repeat protein [Pirellula sp.]|nr:PQQ-binding-like beta-propeller repeat protein [Pirellula sp.]
MKMRIREIIKSSVLGYCSLGLLSGVLSRSGNSEDWTQFRGPGALGASATARLPDEFGGDASKNVAWKVKIPGRSAGGAIVVGDQVITTSSDAMDQRRIRLVSYSAADGKLLWEQQWIARGRPYCHPVSANAAPTPVSDGKRVFAFYSSNDIACVDLQGNPVWYRSLASDFPKAGNDVGMSSSPVVVDGVVIVQVECQGDSFVAGLSAEDGSILWKQDRPKKANWASPSIVKLPNGKNVVVVQSSEDLQAVTPADGKPVWRLELPCSTIPSSVADGNRLIVPAGGLTALDLSSAGEPSTLWKENKLNSNACSPVVAGKNVYVVNRTVLVCGDVYSGKILWQLRLPDAKQIWSSPVVAGDRLYLFSMEGLCFVVALDGEEGKIVQTNKIDDEVLGSPAIAGNAMFVRGANHLWKIATQ